MSWSTRWMGMLGMAAGLAFAAAPVEAQGRTWRFDLTEATNTPVDVETTGSGTATLTFTGNAFRMRVTWRDLVSPTTVAHVHCCTALPNEGAAGVASPLPTFPGFPGIPAGGNPPGVFAGSYDRTFTVAEFINANFITNNGGTLASARSALFTGLDEGRAYLNIHSAQYPAGEINGFSSVVPEPSTYALLGTGLGVIGLVARRRRRAVV